MKTSKQNWMQKWRINLLIFQIVLLLFIIPLKNHAQHWMPLFEHLGNYYDIKAATEAYFMADTSRKSIKSFGYKDFNRWVTFMEPRVDQNGSLISHSIAYNAARNEILNSENYDRIFAEWEPLGPIQNIANMPDPMSKLGLITSIWVDTSNYTTIYAGSNSGGLFVTYNAGQNWKCLTDKYMVTGIEDIIKHAKNPYEIYIGTGYYTWERNYGVGVLKSRDNGLSWQTTGLNSTSFQNEPDRRDINFVVPKIVQHPTDPDTLFALVNFDFNRGSKLMRTYDGGETWSSRVDLPKANTSMLFKIEMDPSDPATMFACGRKILKTNNYWEDSTDLTDLFVKPNERLERASISINPMNPDKILLIYHKVTTDGTDIATRDLLLSEDGGISFISILGTTDISLSNFYKMELEWSKVLENTFYMGGLVVQGYRILLGNIVEEIDLETGYHIDIREFKTYCKKTANPGGGYTFEGLIYQGNDGGITKGSENASSEVTWNDISGNGLNITQYYGIGIPKTNTELIIGGTQDGNYCRYESGDWTLPYDDDAADAVFNYNHPDSVYMVTFMSDWYGMLSIDGGKTWPSANSFSINDTRINAAPIEMSKTNPRRLYIGGKDVWKTTNGIDFQKISDFNNIGYCSNDRDLITIREANPNIIYAGLSGPSWDNCDKRLFKTTNGGANNNWVDITPRIADLPGVPGCNLHNVGISDIAINPHNSNQIYLSVTNNVEGKKVFRYTDGEWINFSEGLPNVPVSCIKYFDHTNLNELFAGTDLGVYYRNDNINEWVPFGNGLPPMIVSDLEINYETNELVAATFGRGVYKVDLCFDPHEINSIYVERSETWDDKIISNDVIITQGAVLTIVGTIGMLRTKHIYIQKGGLLILDGGKITNACKKELWGGVIVYGTSDGPQTLNYQGMINIRNNGTIENASVGIHCLNATNEEGGGIGTTIYTGGGIINADKAWFINNPISVVFEKYTTSSASRFRLCNFVVNDDLFDDATFNYFVQMNEVNGITFTGCSLKNEQTSVAIENRGKGIYSNNSFFMVDQYTSPTLPAKKTSFNDLWYGIYALGQKGGRTLSIQNTDFNYNERGIFAIGVDVINIRNSHFFMKFYNPFVTETKCGIYLDKCTGYIIEENDFHTTLSSPGLIDYGIFINSSGEANNTIYKNKFFDNKYGIAALDKNRNKDGSAGLMLKCNEFNNLKMDIVVMKTEPLSSGMGIATNQGTNEINCEYPAGNLFSNPYPPVTGYYSINNDGGPIVYTHHNMSSNYRVRPSVVTERTVTKISTGFNYTESCCPPHPSGGGGVGRIDGVTLSYKTEAEVTTQTLTTLIDDGDTGEKVIDVNSAAPAEALLIRNNLLQTSPFVSDTVLKTAINREELLNNALLRDIMVANPHSAKSENLMQELDMRLDPMPENMKDEILEGVFVLSAKELMEAKRDMNMQFYNYGFNRLLSASFTDSIPVPIDTLMTLLAADGSAESLMRQAWLYLENGDTTSAINKWNTISNEIPFTEVELTELSQQQAFMQWLVENQPIDTLDMVPLNNFMLYSSPIVTAAARGILVFNNLLKYNEPYLEPDLTKSTEVRTPRVKSVNPEEAYLKVYPNPAKDYITIEYNTSNDKANVVVELFDESGRKVYSEQLIRYVDAIILDTRNFKSGNYIVKLLVDSKTANSAKVVIER